jgi:TPR repeat protein
MKWKWILTIVVGAVLCVVQVASAGQLEDGTAAHDRGDYATAVTLCRPLANQGVAQAQYFLGTMYENGKGVAQDYREAMKWYRLAADYPGYAAPLYALGLMYVNGHGVAQDNVHAYMWYNIAATSGDYAGTLLRDGLAKKMTSAQITQAQEMAKRCQQSKHKDCG